MARWPLWCGVVGAPSHCAAPLRPDLPLPAPACFSLLLLLFSLLLVAPLQDGAIPLYIAAQEGHTEVVAALVAAGAILNQPSKVGGMVVGWLGWVRLCLPHPQPCLLGWLALGWLKLCSFSYFSRYIYFVCLCDIRAGALREIWHS